ncbi:MAG: beta-glucuronidase [Bacteroidaceae bacterium]|nr:beta-glucuronidase [Bacteroidaceae bacterium]
MKIRALMALVVTLLLPTPSSGTVRVEAAPASIDLSGTWRLTSRLEAKSVTLPGSLLTNGLGDDVSTETRWTGSLYDSSFYFNPFMEPYRRAGQMKFPFFLTPRKHFVGEATYSRTVSIPKTWKGRRVTLFMERPHIETTVFVNGHEAGHQMSLSVPHQYDLTPYLRFGEGNELAIRVYNGIENVCVGQDSHSVTDQTQGNWNGIAGCIELRTTPYIYKQHVATDLATRTAHITLNEQTFDIEVPNAQPWSETNPKLYTATVSYEGEPITITFGFREVAVSGRDILLNGEPIHLRGTVENCCFPETGFPPTDTASWERIFRQCKDFGLNHMRFHSYCPPEAAFVAADRLGFYLQPEGPSWPNHGVKLGVGMPIDKYLADECRAILDRYGHHPSFIMLAAGNEPAGHWVEWGDQFVKDMKAYDPSRIYTVASVGGGWEWDYGSEYHVKGGARGLEWNRRQPSSDDDFCEQIAHPRNFKERAPYNPPFGDANSGGKEMSSASGPRGAIISHEQGQWCAFPDLKETDQYTGAYKAANFEIFRDLLAAGGMASQAEKFLMASGRLQVLAYKYEIERHLRTPGYAGFQLLGINDYSGQGTALVGPLNVHWREKGYCTAADWREFCSDLVPLARFPRFTFESTETIRIPVSLYNATSSSSTRSGVAGVRAETPILSYTITSPALSSAVLQQGSLLPGDTITFFPSSVDRAAKLTLTITADATHRNHWDFWVYPDASCETAQQPCLTTTVLDSALAALASGRDVLLLAGGQIKYGNDVVHRFLPVFWNTSWFKMKPPHTTGAYIQADHPIFRNFPTDDWQDLQWWELTNRAQCINLAEFPADFQPIVQPIDTWHLSRKLGMLLEARVGKGRLILTTFDLTTDLNRRIVARQLRSSIMQYMQSPDFQPALTLEPETLRHLFEREAPAVNMFTNDSPDELKPKFSNNP